MSVLEPVILTWQGKEYEVAADKVMGLIERVEDIITLEDLDFTRGLKRARLARAYAAALSYAGKDVSAEDMFVALFDDGGSQASMTSAMLGLMSLMIPPEKLRKTAVNSAPTTRKKKAKGSRKKRTSRRAGRGG